MSNQSSVTVRGPEGFPISLNDMPKPGGRWTPKRKAMVVCGVRGGLLTTSEACERYSIPLEELATWFSVMETRGQDGLKTSALRAIPSREITERAWSVARPKREHHGRHVLLDIMKSTPIAATRAAIHTQKVKRWKDLYSQGYRCVEVSLTFVEPEIIYEKRAHKKSAVKK